MDDGTTIRAIVERIGYEDEQFVFYLFIADNGDKLYYYQEGDRLIPLAEKAGYTNPLKTFLLQLSAAQNNEVIRQYITTMKPTPDSFFERYKVASTGNLNYMKHVRWGVIAGIGIVGIHADLFPYFSSRAQVYGGAFVNIPVLFDGASLQMELTYRKYGFAGHHKYATTKVDAVYNRHDLTPTFLARYTLASLYNKKWLPYAQVGVEPRLAISGKLEMQSRIERNNDATDIYWKNEEYPAKSIALALVAGIGVERKLSLRHSLFFDLRYNQEMDNNSLNGFYFTISYNL
jgi:hypothetical protein